MSRAASADATADDGSFAPAISADGNRVAFYEHRNEPGWSGFDVNGGVRDVFVRDMGAATTSLASRTTGANGISGNGGVGTALDRRVRHPHRLRDVRERPDPGRCQRHHGRAAARHGRADDRAREPRRGCRRCAGERRERNREHLGQRRLRRVRDQRRRRSWRCPRGPTTRACSRGRCAATARSGRCRRRRRPAGPPASPDTTRPVLSRVSIAPRRFLAGRRVKPRTRRRPAIGARLRFTLSEAATRDDPDRRPAAGTAAEEALRPAAARAARAQVHARDPARRADPRRRQGANRVAT